MTEPDNVATTVTPQDAQDFARAFRRFLDWVHSQQDDAARNEVVRLLQGYLGEDGVRRSVVTRTLPVFEHVNLQTALDAWMAQPGRTVEVRGIAIPPHYSGITLQQLLGGEGLPPLRLSAPSLVDLPNGPGSTLACLVRAALLVEDEHGRYVALVVCDTEHQPSLSIEIAGLPIEAAQAVLADLDALRHRLNVYRGRVLDISVTDMGGLSLHLATPPSTTREDVILPDEVLTRIERHAVGISAHREALLQAGQHLKRGLLLYGPPGTGKTHTTRYLMGQLDGYTRLTLTGRALHAIGSVTELARELEPAAVVLEDVDLVAGERGYGHGSAPVLFDLLDAMDGAAPDADLLFVLTTNRADLLEPALAARPGRVDVAVAVDVPDHAARLQLLDLYASGVPVRLTDEERVEIADRTEGVTASFLKELLRRAVLEALTEHSPLEAVTAQHFTRALDDLMDSAQAVTRTLLGVADSNGDGDGAAGGEGGGDGSAGDGSAARYVPVAMGARPGRAMPSSYRGSFGWTSYGPR